MEEFLIIYSNFLDSRLQICVLSSLLLLRLAREQSYQISFLFLPDPLKKLCLDLMYLEADLRYSVENLNNLLFSAKCAIISSRLSNSNDSGTAITCLTLPYSKSSNTLMSASVSFIQSLPVI